MDDEKVVLGEGEQEFLAPEDAQTYEDALLQHDLEEDLAADQFAQRSDGAMPEAAEDIETVSMWRDTLRRLRRDKLAVASAILLLAVIVISALAPLIAPHDPYTVVLTDRLKPPFTPGHLFGTDQLGRDVLSRLIYGGRISVTIGVAAVLVALAFGIVIGLLAGYYKGFVDTVSIFGLNVLNAFPYILLAIAIIAALGPGLTNAMIAISIVGIPYYARIVRGQVFSLRERDFIQAERALGASDWRIITRHILPNCISPIIVAATLDVGWMIVMAAGLSFLGLGAQPPTAEWGVILSDGQQYIQNAPYISLLAGMMIFIVVLCLNFLGDGLRDALDPNLKN
ncbi:MAG: ABC transporter permease [Coriobacteriia bacterium]|nr:ABC transporter permease [Coriobacteriia bacterium]